MNKLTFKDYLESKKSLQEAVKKTPKQQKQYIVNRYCNCIIGETKDTKQKIPLKPKNTCTVEWLYEDINNPTPISLSFDGVNNIDPYETFPPWWTGERMQKWLLRNTHESY